MKPLIVSIFFLFSTRCISQIFLYYVDDEKKFNHFYKYDTLNKQFEVRPSYKGNDTFVTKKELDSIFNIKNHGSFYFKWKVFDSTLILHAQFLRTETSLTPLGYKVDVKNKAIGNRGFFNALTTEPTLSNIIGTVSKFKDTSVFYKNKKVDCWKFFVETSKKYDPIYKMNGLDCEVLFSKKFLIPIEYNYIINESLYVDRNLLKIVSKKSPKIKIVNVKVKNLEDLYKFF